MSCHFDNLYHLLFVFGRFGHLQILKVKCINSHISLYNNQPNQPNFIINFLTSIVTNLNFENYIVHLNSFILFTYIVPGPVTAQQVLQPYNNYFEVVNLINYRPCAKLPPGLILEGPAAYLPCSPPVDVIKYLF